MPRPRTRPLGTTAAQATAAWEAARRAKGGRPIKAMLTADEAKKFDGLKVAWDLGTDSETIRALIEKAAPRGG